MARIQLKRGPKAAIPTTGLLTGEPIITTDRGTVHVATGATTTMPVVPAIDDLVTLAAVATGDLLIVHDLDGTGQKEKKITFDNFKTALNIPAGSSDEKTAVVSGGTSGYLWGTDGTDGIIRHSNGVEITKDASNGFITLMVDTVDGGTFA